MKANYTPEILKIIKEQGLSVITVSGLEIKLALKIGFQGKQIFFNGNGKQIWEIELAIENGCFINVDSKFDATNICSVAEKKDAVVQVLKNSITTTTTTTTTTDPRVDWFLHKSRSNFVF